jgi:ring-1,2-phenylacetyl-CoA epoxidase subunit PaaE
MSKFHELKVKEVKKETQDCVSVAFEIPASLQQDFKYEHGQYIIIRHHNKEEDLRRSYSVCSSPVTDNDLRVAIKKVEGGIVSTWINDSLKAGDILEVMTPRGNFRTPLSSENNKSYVLFAAGSGITPVMSIIKSVLAVEPKSNVVLFYGNRNHNSVIFSDELQQLENKFSDRLKVVHIYSRPEGNVPDSLFSGRIDATKAELLLQKFHAEKKETEYFMCGPSGLIDTVKNLLLNKGIDKKHIHVEYFSASTDGHEISPESTPKEVYEGNSSVTVIMDGIETSFTLNGSKTSVLDAAIEAGVDAPFSCKGAVCCTCKAKLIEGKVNMEMNYALTDEEIDQGFILTCQSHPASPKVIIDYDQAF